MKHGMVYRRLSRSPKHLQALLRNLTGELIDHEAIKTTVPRAKELKRYAERVITLGKRGAESELRKVLYEESLVRKLLFELAPRYAERQGGYTRVLKCGFRFGDKAETAIIELVDRPNEIRPKGALHVSPDKASANSRPKPGKTPPAKTASQGRGSETHARIPITGEHYKRFGNLEEL